MERAEELQQLIERGERQLVQARALKLRELVKSIRYDLARWREELAG